MGGYVQATRRKRLCKTLEQHSAVLKRELLRPTDVAADRQERERGADDAEAMLCELAHPAVGLRTPASLATEPALQRIVELVREQVARLRRGEVDKGQAASPILCPHCSTELIKKAWPGNYCD